MRKKKQETKTQSLDASNIVLKNYVLYAKELNNNRAFPHILPGVKPVAGNSIWSMYFNKRLSSKEYTKSAKVTGEVMNFHPHSSVYESLVKLSQDFIYHIPLIDGDGNFGSKKGGPDAAADRYTSMRLSKFAEDVFFYNTKALSMGLNYLEEDPQPILNQWVSLLPVLFISGASGIGYSESSLWSPGNLFEFRDKIDEYLKTGGVSCSDIYPDFPDGGIIINKSEMKDLYETGKGTVKLRGEAVIKGNVIQIKSLPYQVYVEPFIEHVKKLTIEGVSKNSNGFDYIRDIRDLCDKTKFLIEIETEEGYTDLVLELLYKKTNLQVTFANNRQAVSEDGRIKLYTLFDYVESFVKANVSLVKKETEIQIPEIESRLEILNGLLSALEIIDKIIKEIKSSKSIDDAKKKLVAKFKFTENQAKAIVSMPLGRLSNLEKITIEKEKKELDKNLTSLSKLIKSKKLQEKAFYDRFSKLVDKYGYQRKTKVIDVDEEKSVKIIKKKAPKKVQEYMIVLTSDNKIKKIPIENYKESPGDVRAIKTSSKKFIYITSDGMMYKHYLNKMMDTLPDAMGEDICVKKITNIFPEETEDNEIVFITKLGYVKKSLVKDTLLISKDIGAIVMKLKEEGDELIFAGSGQINKLKTNQREIKINANDVRISGRNAGGARAFNRRKNEVIVEIL